MRRRALRPTMLRSWRMRRGRSRKWPRQTSRSAPCVGTDSSDYARPITPVRVPVRMQKPAIIAVEDETQKTSGFKRPNRLLKRAAAPSVRRGRPAHDRYALTQRWQEPVGEGDVDGPAAKAQRADTSEVTRASHAQP